MLSGFGYFLNYLPFAAASLMKHGRFPLQTVYARSVYRLYIGDANRLRRNGSASDLYALNLDLYQ